MFSGIVAAVGTVVSVDAAGADRAARRITIGATESLLADAKPADSIAVDGVCLTVVDRDRDVFTVDVVGTTVARTTVGGFEPGRQVNLELALAVGDRIDGHMVQGHVDGMGRVEKLERQADQVLLDISLPAAVAEVTVPRGSIAINGVSLTVSEIPAPGRARVALIPYTWEHTNLSGLELGSEVNIESDMLGRFVVHYLKLRDGG